MAEQAQTLGSSAQFSSKLIKPKKSTLIIMAIVLLVGVLFIFRAWHLPPFALNSEQTDNSYIKGQTTILSSQINGYVKRVLVKDFDHVKIAVIYCATKFYVASFTEGLALAMQTQGKKMRVKVLAPGATATEFVGQASVNGGIDGDHLFSPEAFISAEQLADYAYQLYQSDKVVGIVNEQNGFDLKDLIYPRVVLGS